MADRARRFYDGIVAVTSQSVVRCGEALASLAKARMEITEVAGEAVPRLRRAVGFDTWCFSLRDPASLLPTQAAADNAPLADEQLRLWQIEYRHRDVLAFAELVRAPTKLGGLAHATGGQPGRSRRFADVLAPAGFGDELRACLVADGVCWGALTVYRGADSARFSEAELALVAGFLPALAGAARGAWTAGSSSLRRRMGDPAGPGTLLLSSAGTPLAQTSAGSFWLARLPSPQKLLAPMLARVGAGSSVKLRTRTRDGQWVAIHGAPLGPGLGPATVAVTIQAATTADLLPLLLRAYGLSRRQRDVSRLLLAGQCTDEIAATLSISPHTVNDHIKAITARVGVRGRHRLVARLGGGLPPGVSPEHG